MTPYHRYLFAPCQAWLLLVSALLLPAAMTEAHLPALYGRDFLRYQGPAESGSDVAKPPAGQEEEVEPADSEPFTEAVSAQEIAAGPYAQGLVEPLYGLGYYYRDQGDFDAAIETLLRALHISRVNDGLNSDRQLPVLRQLMAVYRESDQLRDLDQSYEYFFRLHGMASVPLSDKTLDAGLEYLRWQREAHNAGIDGTARNRILQAYQTNERILDALYADPDASLGRLRDYTLSQLYNLYLLLGMQPVAEQIDGLVSGFNHGGQFSSGDWVRQRVERIEQTGLADGEKLLTRLIERSVDEPAEDVAALYLELGDWCQWNSSYRRADAAYAQVVQLLTDAGRADLVELWLAEPVELPDEADIWFGGQPPVTEGDPVLTLRFDLSSRGDAVDFEVLEASIAGRDIRLMRMLRETHFRARLVSGAPEAVTGVVRTYRLLD